MGDREKYVETLRLERAEIAGRAESPTRTRRLAELDEALDRFTEKPAARRVEKADATEPPTRRPRHAN